ncbi:hypothetical protein AB0C04_28800 [Micromonospora sp. NPDC048909]|uniref:hypothetical protein n=1 Tax=Micromonospora sp. NPDC048909 TaxID=3155643 RepID=UPI00340D111B
MRTRRWAGGAALALLTLTGPVVAGPATAAPAAPPPATATLTDAVADRLRGPARAGHADPQTRVTVSRSGAGWAFGTAANGTSHTGRYGTTALWDRLSDGSWVSDAYLWTGVNGPINGWC